MDKDKGKTEGPGLYMGVGRASEPMVWGHRGGTKAGLGQGSQWGHSVGVTRGAGASGRTGKGELSRVTTYKGSGQWRK